MDNYKYNIYVIGTGSTGSLLLNNLAQYAISEKNIKEILLIDGDVVEPKNYINQKFTARDVGKNKARVLATRYAKLGINISFVDKYITNKDFLIDIIKKDNHFTNVLPIIVSCVDNNNARIILNDIFNELNNVIYIDVGNGDETSRIGQVVMGAKSKGKVVLEPVVTFYPNILEGDIESVEKTQDFSCSTVIKEKPQHLATNVLSSTTVFLMLCNLISYGIIPSNYLTFSAEKMTLGSVL